MKHTIKLLALALGAFARYPGLATANAASKSEAAPAPEPSATIEDLQRRIAEQDAQIAELKAAIGKPVASAAPAPESAVSRLAKGAGLDTLDDVSWRIAAGLSPDQAVQAAVDQQKIRTGGKA